MKQKITYCGNNVFRVETQERTKLEDSITLFKSLYRSGSGVMSNVQKDLNLFRNLYPLTTFLINTLTIPNKNLSLSWMNYYKGDFRFGLLYNENTNISIKILENSDYIYYDIICLPDFILQNLKIHIDNINDLLQDFR